MVDELVQSTAMEWILTFLEFAQDTVVAFTPRIVPAILPNLASPQYVPLFYLSRSLTISRHIKLAAHETNGSLYRVIQSLSLQIQHPTPSSASNAGPSSTAASPNATLALTSTSPPTARKEGDALEPPPLKDPLADSDAGKGITSSASASNVASLKIKPSNTVPLSEPVTPINFEFPAGIKAKSRPSSPNVPTQATPRSTTAAAETVDEDAFDVRETVNVLTLQFLSDHAETRIAALEWLLMLHLKAPQKVRLYPAIANDRSCREIVVLSPLYSRRCRIRRKMYVHCSTHMSRANFRWSSMIYNY